MSIDIRQIKREKRAKIKEWRHNLPEREKSVLDREIAERFFKSYVYKRTHQVFIYVSTPIEVDTLNIISHAAKDGKRIACPRCVDGTREMEFYYIDSIDDLEPGTFGVLEPKAEKNRLVTDFSDGVCVVPGLAFDSGGFRLGYGKGYYDRFLSGYKGFTCGLCYLENVVKYLPHGRFDRHVGLLITESFSRRCK